MKAQISTEFLLILGVLFILLTVFIITSQEELTDVTTSHIEQKGQTSADALSAAAKEVYSQGFGSRKRVYVDIPSAYDPTRSGTLNRTLILHVLGSDMVRTFDFDIVGQLPNSPGPQWVWVTNEGSHVRIGLSLLSLDRQSVYVIMGQNTTANDTLFIQNVHTGQVNVTITPSWTSAHVNISLSSTQVSLSSNQTFPLLINFPSLASAIGTYSGSLALTASSGNATEVIYVPVIVEVTATLSTVPPLWIIPNVWNSSLLPSQNVSKSFIVCTNSATSVTDVSFNASGTAGAWVTGLEALPAMGPDTCLTKIFNMSIANATNAGNYTGFITAQGGGVPSATDSVALFIEVGSNPSDIVGPLATNFGRSPSRVFFGSALTVSAVCDDTNRGNNTISRGEIRVGNTGSWSTLTAVDGSYDSIMENVSHTFTPTQPGFQNVTFRCTDSLNNVGPEANYTFTVMKEIVLITKDQGSAQGEQNWDEWLTIHSSALGYSWSFDRVHRKDITDGVVDINGYAVALLAEAVTSGSTGNSLVTLLNTYRTNGGYVVIVDKAVRDTSADFGIGSNPQQVTQNVVTISGNSHYITSSFSNNASPRIYHSSSAIYYFDTGTSSLVRPSVSSPIDHAVLIDTNRIIAWGVTRPYRLNINGTTISAGVFDYAINTSTIGS